MTECERLLQEGVVTEDFLKEEVISGHTVTTGMKKLWAIELDLLKEFKRVCEKYNLKWYVISGTLLGTIRHKGFVPWDDDLDICMPREDYDILTQKYASEFKMPYFMQTPYTDKEYAYSFAKLRNSNTSFAAEAFIESDMNQGVFLDIYPMDDSEGGGYLDRREEIVRLLRKCSAFMCRNNKYVLNKHTEFAKSQSFAEDDGIRLYEEIHKISSSSRQTKCEYCSVEVVTIYSPERNRWLKSSFDEVTEMPFCNTTVLVPNGWKHVLEVIYGDFMSFPPVEERGKWHCEKFLDVDMSYKVVRDRYIESLKER